MMIVFIMGGVQIKMCNPIYPQPETNNSQETKSEDMVSSANSKDNHAYKKSGSSPDNNSQQTKPCNAKVVRNHYNGSQVSSRDYFREGEDKTADTFIKEEEQEKLDD